MTNCRFCSGKAVNGYSVGNGIKTMKEMAKAVFGVSIEEDELDNGIILVNGNKMHIDSSSGEYDPVEIEIKYCPFCGIKLAEKENDDE